MAGTAKTDSVVLDLDYVCRFLEGVGEAASKGRVVKVKQKKNGHTKVVQDWPSRSDYLALERGLMGLQAMRALSRKP